MGYDALCNSCNSYFGRHYVPEFSRVFNQLNTIVINELKPEYQSLAIQIPSFRPLAFCKQIISNFCTINKAGALSDCKDYLLNKEERNFPERYRLYMAIIGKDSTATSMGWSLTLGNSGEIRALTYLCMPPITLTLYDMDRCSAMPVIAGDMTSISTTAWDEISDVTLTLPVESASK
ncbi:hypothetical protein OZX57_04450 [Bifidobacterium sp. ESL0682]|uniref:hypothetical protein n=1 Tax=Bifidobacterium sp. ESL0682 TaxID=2983212 RepID=UPI0023F89B4E|nr:hypothetical protein [Bifidobacterium sp. ESL0682]WEV42655.1 hypothetical protein OZX57_04450 [Bifidobacterium sp. ESL0682]